MIVGNQIPCLPLVSQHLQKMAAVSIQNLSNIFSDVLQNITDNSNHIILGKFHLLIQKRLLNGLPYMTK